MRDGQEETRKRGAGGRKGGGKTKPSTTLIKALGFKRS